MGQEVHPAEVDDEREQAEQLGALITGARSPEDLADADFVIEAVFEDYDLKKQVFSEVEAVVGPDTLLCSNTSTLPITSLQEFSSRPADFIGLHFFSPVDKMQLVEIIRGEQTSDEATARAIDIVQQIRKIPVVVGDGRGFYTSRVFGTLILEGAVAVAEGIDPMVVERAATTAGFPAPPLAMLDEVSLTLTQHIRAEADKAAAAEGTTLPKGPGEELIDTMVAEGRKGRAAGAGMYDYPADGPKVLWPGLRERFAKGTQVPLRDLQDRYLFIMALETAGCFEDGVLTDTASVHRAAWKTTFDAYLAEHHPDQTPFDAERDYLDHVDGKPREAGVRDFLASRGLTLPDGSRCDAPGTQTVWGIGNLKNEAVIETIRRDGRAACFQRDVPAG